MKKYTNKVLITGFAIFLVFALAFFFVKPYQIKKKMNQNEFTINR
jgi:hypothetical protein